MKQAISDHPQIHPKTTAEWRRWLRENHEKQKRVWLLTYRPATGRPALSYEDTVVEALAYGWIDSLNRPLDEQRTALLFTPRRPGSGWAKTNKARIARMIKEGRMAPAGLAKVAAAKRDGSWTLLDSVEALEVPEDLRKALGPAGLRAFKKLAPSHQKQHLAALVTAKRPETRAKRVAAVVSAVRTAR